MQRKDMLVYIGKEVMITYENQRNKPCVLSGVVSVCHHHELFLRGSFPSRRASKLSGGVWLDLHRIISLQEIKRE